MKKILALILSICMIACVCVSLTACNKDEADFTVGVIQLLKHDALDAATQGFVDELNAQMQAAGKTVKIDIQLAGGEVVTCATIAENFVGKSYDLILGNATPALVAAMNKTATIPVLGTSVTDYSEIITADIHNVSGTSDLADLKDQADLFTDLIPDANRIGLLYCASETNSKYQVDIVKAYLEEAGKTTVEISFEDTKDIDSILRGKLNEVDAIYIPTDNKCADNTALIDSICRPAGIPIIAGEEAICKGCGIATRTISYYDLGKLTGKMAADILLRGADISTMEVKRIDQVGKYNKEIVDALKAKGVNITIDTTEFEEIK